MSKKVALVTGATGGIGLATATALAKDGYTVVINGIDDAQAATAIASLKEVGAECEYVNFDVTNEAAVASSVAAIGEKYGVIDVVVNNAGGLGGRSRFEEMTTDFYRNVMALNVDSAFFVTRAAIPFLKKSENASIVNFASNAAWNAGGPGAGIYGVSKAAIVTLTRAFAKDLAEYGIRSNAVSPGTIDTPFHDNIKKTNPQVFESWKNNILMKRFGQPEEVASVISFLCSEKASFLTGEIIQVNGGQDFL
ncbi:SDR family NAD(P)-dependent oxidoreductase [Tannockella kyphosi]|uniref:SDR family NAD(P)-dependent oxidoreductase n=1 Tax=Tannockella kyphosi TaxID=2899121 RepID=UPI0020129099|nr:SDR family NAD(P)-dependent oxidoreductase [Tannockella kyphosi]